MIHYIQPYAVDKNIGKAYNDACQIIYDHDPEAWICITDQDVMFLSPYSKQILQEIANRGQFDLVSCLTNRLNRENKHQLIDSYQETFNDKFISMYDNDNDNIADGIDAATQLERYFGHHVKRVKAPIAGMLMLFKASTWNNNRFKENCLTFDYAFSNSISDKGGSIGVALGVYIFHLYRWNAPKGEEHLHCKHLLP